MIPRWSVIKEIARDAADVGERVIADHRNGFFVDEPQITDRLLGALADRLRGTSQSGVTWTARTLRSGHGSANEESRHGADFFGVLRINLPDLRIGKGFLVQAKRAEPGNAFDVREWRRLQDQCDKMLNRTAASYVIAYSTTRGLRFFPAIEIAASSARDLFEHRGRTMRSFIELLLECFVGDRRLNQATIETLDELDVPLGIEIALESDSR